MTCIIVMGCFRSGTSAVAGALHHLGVFMGNQFDPPNNNNPKGFWEDLEFKALHAAYEDYQSDSYDKGSDLDAIYKQLIFKREAEHALWGVKDPLICKHLNKLVPNLVDHKLIVCRRPVEEIAASMSKAMGVSDHKWLLPLAQSYVDELNLSLSSYSGPVLEVQKTDNMLQVLEPICEFVGLPSNQAAVDFLS